jgi:spore coat protein B
MGVEFFMIEDMNIDINKYFIGKVIRVDRGGPESRIGMLLDASEDHLCLLTEEDGVVYYNTKHIKSFTDKIKGRWNSTLKFLKI